MSAPPVCSFGSQQNSSATPSGKNFEESRRNTKSAVTRQKSEMGHTNLITRVRTQPNSKNYSSLIRTHSSGSKTPKHARKQQIFQKEKQKKHCLRSKTNFTKQSLKKAANRPNKKNSPARFERKHN